MEELIRVLGAEDEKYKDLLELSKKKTPILVEGDIEKLQKITDEEQVIVDEVANLELSRQAAMEDIANVLNKDVKTLKLSYLEEVLGKRPKEREELTRIHDRLKATIGELMVINSQNRELIRQSLDMIDFNLSLAKSMRTAPETGNYTKNAANAGSVLGSAQGGFDAKQ
ncbi:MAG: flagellar protein FlgN [Lachnospiraceae bacterium]|nr:flagellar protein FlgN [Lachnospiraceae bacterium]MBR2187262.1 flagellar protein FlgN [Lachnospiraceae bacterium]